MVRDLSPFPSIEFLKINAVEIDSDKENEKDGRENLGDPGSSSGNLSTLLGSPRIRRLTIHLC